MNFDAYRAAAESLAARPPSTAHPEGQKFHTGDTVKIINPVRREEGQLFTVEYSYHQKYPEMSDGSRHKRDYALRNLATDVCTSWYSEEELTLAQDVLDAEFISE